MDDLVTSAAPTQRLLPDVDVALRRVLLLVDSAAGAMALPHASDPDDTAAAAARQQVSDWLYSAWYSVVHPAETAPVSVPLRRDLVSALRASLPASERWQTGWVVLHCGASGTAVAAKGEQTRQLQPGDYANVGRPGMPIAPGDSIAVVDRLDWSDEQTGFWHAQSSRGEPARPLLRLYWSVRPEHVAAVLHELCSAIDALDLRYSLKCPLRANEYARVDSLVVYLERDAWPAADPVVRNAAARLAARLRPSRPPLTLALAPGVAMAEDPGSSESFGQSRCRALAPAVLALLRKPAPATTDRLAILTDALRAVGIAPECPWLSRPA